MKKLTAAIISGFLFGVTSQLHALNAEQIYNKVNKSVYTIYTVNFYDKSPESLGSAIAVTDHVLATNCHVAMTGNYLGIVVNNEFKLGTLFFRDVNRDICFVEIPGMSFTPVKIRDSKDVHVGEQVFAVGNPEGLEKSISQGIISNKRQDRGGFVLQTDATVSFGSSGGGLFDQNGQLIGITNSVDKYSKNIAFAIPSEWISQILFPKNLASETNKTAASGGVASNVTPTQPKVVGPSDDVAKVTTKIGQFGKANISLYRYKQKCFVFFTGKNEYGETAGSAIWYPEKPGIMLFFPNSTDITKDFKIMNQVFYGNQDQNPSYSGDYLFYDSKKYELVGVKDENERYPLLVTKLPDDSRTKMPSLQGFEIKYSDGMTVAGYTKQIFGLDGFKEALASYEKQCPVAKK